MEFRPTRTRRGWWLAVAQEGSDPVALEVRGARVRDGAVRASLVVRRGATIVVTALVTLTSESARKRFVDSLRDKGVVVPEQALVALDEVCHLGAEPADGSEDHDPVADEHTPHGASRPLAELLDAVERLLSRYVIFRTPAQRTAVVLWVAHAHAFEAAEVTPYLHVHSAEMESGKTRLLEVLEWLVPRPWHVIGPSEAVLFRMIAREVPTLLFDEVDTIFRGAKSRTPEAAGLRQVLKCGLPPQRGRLAVQRQRQDRARGLPGLLSESAYRDRCRSPGHGCLAVHPHCAGSSDEVRGGGEVQAVHDPCRDVVAQARPDLLGEHGGRVLGWS